MNGVLIYAFNNQRIDYWRQAVWCADRVEKYTGLPVSIVSDEISRAGRECPHNMIVAEPKSGGTRIFDHVNDTRGHAWYNRNRYQSWDISPYEKTLVLDSDYIVSSDQLLRLFESDISVTAIKHVYDVTHRDQFRLYQRISDSRGLHHYWATVLYFDRRQPARDFFRVMAMIQDNYSHYAQIYNFPVSPFRNDFAVSVALNTIYGHVPEAIPEIPWAMANVFSDVEIRQIDDITFEFEYLNGDRRRRVRLSGQDFHFMNKISLEKIYEV